MYKKICNGNTPEYSDEQLQKIFTVAIKPKEINERNTIIKLFRCFRNGTNMSKKPVPHTGE